MRIQLAFELKSLAWYASLGIRGGLNCLRWQSCFPSSLTSSSLENFRIKHKKCLKERNTFFTLLLHSVFFSQILSHDRSWISWNRKSCVFLYCALFFFIALITVYIIILYIYLCYLTISACWNVNSLKVWTFSLFITISLTYRTVCLAHNKLFLNE